MTPLLGARRKDDGCDIVGALFAVRRQGLPCQGPSNVDVSECRAQKEPNVTSEEAVALRLGASAPDTFGSGCSSSASGLGCHTNHR